MNHKHGKYHGMPKNFYDKNKNPKWRHASYAAYKRDKGICQMCGDRPDRENIDHIIPISPKSSDELKYGLSNLQTLCIPCHNEKGSQDLQNFIKNESNELRSIFKKIQGR